MALSTADLKRELKRLAVPAARLAACIERHEFEALYAEEKVKAELREAEAAKAPPKPQPATPAAGGAAHQPKAAAQKAAASAAASQATGLPGNLSWQAVLMFGLVAYYVASGLGLMSGGDGEDTAAVEFSAEDDSALLEGAGAATLTLTLTLTLSLS